MPISVIVQFGWNARGAQPGVPGKPGFGLLGWRRPRLCLALKTQARAPAPHVIGHEECQTATLPDSDKYYSIV